MNIIINPSKSKWDSLTQRPYTENNSIVDSVKEIFKNVKKNGDKSIIDYTLKFDNVKIDKLKVSENLINDSEDKISSNLKKAIDLAYNNIYKFHSSQLQKKNIIEVQKGINCWQEKRPINNVGLYIPGGSAPLFSTVLMLGIPSLIANCVNRILCTPPNFKNEIAPEILYACKVCGINNIFKVGGAQAIAAMTFGTESIPKIDKIFGPGNQYVPEA